MKQYLVYCAWPYATGSLHLGRIGSTMARTYAHVNYLNLLKENVICGSGTDMHGEPVIAEAIKENKHYVEHAYCKHNAFKEKTEQWHLNMFYTHTDTKFHYVIVKNVINILSEKNLLFFQDNAYFYCEVCRKRLLHRFVKGKCANCGMSVNKDICENCWTENTVTNILEPVCTICGSIPLVKKEKTVFLQLNFKQEILKYVQQQYPVYYKQVEKFYEKPYREIARFTQWGIALDFLHNASLYVWIDALIGYITLWNMHCRNKQYTMFIYIGQDNWFFHLVILPFLFLHYNLPLPTIKITKYLLSEQGKFSNSESRIIEIEDFKDRGLSNEFTMFYLNLKVSEKTSVKLQVSEAVSLYNTWFIDKFINLFRRIKLQSAEYIITVKDVHKQDIYDGNTKHVLEFIYNSVLELNKYCELIKPWHGNKFEKVYDLFYCIYLLQPIIPQTINLLLQQINAEQKDNTFLIKEFKMPFFTKLGGDNK